MEQIGEYVSPERYRKMYPGMGVETIKKMLRAGKLEGYIDEDPDTKFAHYYILVKKDNDSQYSQEYVKKLEATVAKYEEKFESAKKLLSI
ncbi:MAG: hypothetical protein J6B87_03075 [Clostridia bacterium]|nr:hypothetical protein [Clostridia bacterium]